MNLTMTPVSGIHQLLLEAVKIIQLLWLNLYMTHLLRALLFFLLTAFFFSLPVLAHDQNSSVSVNNLRNKRYCEILYGNWNVFSLNIKVFSTQGLNDCPESDWRRITKKAIADKYAASFVKLNGPRYWTIDGLEAAGETVNHIREDFGGIEMNLRATLQIGPLTVLREFLGLNAYRAAPVARTTVWVYRAGSPVFELIAPSGEHYIMQSYSQIVDQSLSMTDLPSLEQKLELPKGWSYRSSLLTEDFRLVASGIAYVLQDSLLNSYQLIPN